MEEKYKELLERFLEAIIIYEESGFDNALFSLNDEVNDLFELK